MSDLPKSIDEFFYANPNAMHSTDLAIRVLLGHPDSPVRKLIEAATEAHKYFINRPGNWEYGVDEQLGQTLAALEIKHD